ncbi:SsrA-binding protein SmpB [Salisaeta longa]|uniref:SsrA-binding protein SmpB n=1 Tax=Salisaeta longa TaxID=503170 RepID=UPI0003B6935F|nr:SsrA-binding protein SmpB [Salisaeta longa]
MSTGIKTVERNKKARYEYAIEDTVEAGIVLKGSEVKSVRAGKVSLDGAYCAVDRYGEMLLHDAYIKPYEQAGHFNHDARRTRKLLLHSREIERWAEAANRKGYTIVPLELYLRDGWVKLKIGLGKGKKQHDKRQTIKERESTRRLEEQRRAYNL